MDRDFLHKLKHGVQPDKPTDFLISGQSLSSHSSPTVTANSVAYLIMWSKQHFVYPDLTLTPVKKKFPVKFVLNATAVKIKLSPNGPTMKKHEVCLRAGKLLTAKVVKSCKRTAKEGKREERQTEMRKRRQERKIREQGKKGIKPTVSSCYLSGPLF